MENEPLLRSCCSDLGIDISDNQIDLFIMYYEHLVKVNENINLTAITDYDDVIIKHFVDSISCCRFIDMNKIETLIDIGTGAGFPGIPLKILFPHIQLCLLDSLQKRINFLNETCQILGLLNVECLHGRAEEIAQKPKYREAYDLCVSRAVSRLNVLSEYCLPFVKVNGSFISYKSVNIEEELKEAGNCIRILGGEIRKIYKMTLPNSEYERTLIEIKKIKQTGKKYPRKAGIPQKQPIM